MFCVFMKSSMKPADRNLTWHAGDVTREERERLLGQLGGVVWLTGLSASGKSTIARALERHLLEQGRGCYVLDGDNLRHGLNVDLGFSAADRTENIRRVGEVAALFAEAGVIVITAFISPYRADRQQARARVPEDRFLEVFLDVPLAVCEARDPKHLYAQARAGKLLEFTGISAPYEPPNPGEALALPAGEMSVAEAVARITCELRSRGWLMSVLR